MKNGQYYAGVITVTRSPETNSVVTPLPSSPQDVIKKDDTDKGCRTKPMHLRVTAKGSFIGGLKVFAGDARTETMLQQLLKFFGPNPKNGLVLDGVLTCKQERQRVPRRACDRALSVDGKRVSSPQ
mmetsp:Transcript_66814/g.178618  ORF Transcript_66814/g.178618 Transcript_66814/m.178618 type:complete len:126 (-) Transcript_66814:326-703(-)